MEFLGGNSMSKFCTSCGAQLSDDAGFCTVCGAQQNSNSQPAPNAQQVNVQQPKAQQGGQPGSQPINDFAQAAGNFAHDAAGTVKQTFEGVSFDSVKDSMTIDNIKNVGKTKNKNTIIGLSAIAVVVIIIVIILASCLSGGYKDPVDDYIKAITKTDGNAMSECLPDAVNEYVEDEVMDSKYDSVDEYYEDILEDMLDVYELKYGDNVKMSYKITKKKEIKDSDLEDVEDSINDNYDADVKVTKGYKLKVKMTIKGEDDDDDSSDWISVYKIDGKWCFSDRSMFYTSSLDYLSDLLD
jgi:hypothetical protein